MIRRALLAAAGALCLGQAALAQTRGREDFRQMLRPGAELDDATFAGIERLGYRGHPSNALRDNALLQDWVVDMAMRDRLGARATPAMESTAPDYFATLRDLRRQPFMRDRILTYPDVLSVVRAPARPGSGLFMAPVDAMTDSSGQTQMVPGVPDPGSIGCPPTRLGYANCPPRYAALGQAVSAVVELQAGPLVGRCSGTLVAPDLIVTARHCVNADGQIAGSPPAEKSSIRVRRVGGAWTGVRRIVTFDLGLVWSSQDVAFLKLEAPLGGRPATVSPAPSSSLFVVLAGFGVTNLGNTGNAGLAWAHHPIEFAALRSNGSPAVGWGTDKGGVNCAGDSGGPVFLQASDGTLQLVGVMSQVTGNHSTISPTRCATFHRGAFIDLGQSRISSVFCAELAKENVACTTPRL